MVSIVPSEAGGYFHSHACLPFRVRGPVRTRYVWFNEEKCNVQGGTHRLVVRGKHHDGIGYWNRASDVAVCAFLNT